MEKHCKCFSVKILDYYNITVHSLVCNKFSETTTITQHYHGVIKSNSNVRREIGLDKMHYC